MDQEGSSLREYLSYGALRAHGIPTARTSFTMLPWDMNLSQTDFWHPCGDGRNTQEWPISNRLLGDEDHTAEYAELMAAMLAGSMSYASLEARLDQSVVLVGDWISPELEDALLLSIQYRVEMLEAGLTGLTTCPITTE